MVALPPAAAIALQVGASVGISAAIAALTKPVEPDVAEENAPPGGPGSPLDLAFGQTVSVDAQVLWRRRRPEKRDRGGLFTKRTEVNYFADIAFGLADATEDEIHSLENLYLGGKLIYQNGDDIAFTSDQLSVSRNPFMVIDSPVAGVDLVEATKKGGDATISGFTKAGNNGTFPILNRVRRSTGATRLLLYNETAEPEPAGPEVTVTQPFIKFNRREIRSLTLYTGSATQDADPLMSARVGPGEQDAWRGVAWAMGERVNLNDWVGSIPQARAVISTSATPVMLADIVRAICTRPKEVTDAMIDTSGIAPIEVRGYRVRPLFTPLEALDPLVVAYNLMAQQRDGKLVFFTRENAPVINIRLEELGSHAVGDDESDRPFRVDDPADAEVPSTLSVRYTDPDRDYQPETATEPGPDGRSENRQAVDLTSLVLTAEEAREAAARVRWFQEAGRHRIRGTLPFARINLQENDTLAFSDADGTDWRVLLDNSIPREDGIVEFEGIRDVPSILSIERIADPTLLDPQTIFPPSPLDTQLIDVAPLSNEHLRLPMLYVGSVAFNPDADFEAAEVHLSRDGTNFEPIDIVGGTTTGGLTLTALGPGTPGIYDLKNKVQVEVWGGELVSRPREDLLVFRRNLCMVGREMIAFENAELLESAGEIRTYELSGLLRGLRNTARFVGSHDVNERFVMIDDQPLIAIELDVSDVGRTVYLKSVPFGTTAEEAIATPVTYEGETMKPWGPWRIRGNRNATSFTTAEGILIQWDRRSRELSTFLGPKGLIEDLERYRIQILDSAGAGGGGVVNTYFATRTEQWFYSRSRLEGDGLTWGDDVDIRISQWSERLGQFGHDTEGTV